MFVFLGFAPNKDALGKVKPNAFTKDSDMQNIRYAGETTLITEREEELKSLLMKVKEESEKLA